MAKKDLFSCNLVSAQEPGSIELEKAGEIKRSSLREVCGAVFEILPTGTERKIKPSDTVEGKGTLVCSVCRNVIPVDFSITLEGFLNAYASSGKECSKCNSRIRMTGLTTENEGEIRSWLLVMRETQPANAVPGTFQLNMAELKGLPSE